MSTSAAIERLQAKVNSRGTRLSPTLTEAQVASFEQSHGVRLPSDYREFLLRIGNGGDGPAAYGLCALGTIPFDFGRPAPELSKPFHFTQSWIWEGEAASAKEGKDDVYCGVLILGTDGCGLYWALILRGPEVGRIWMLADVGITPVVPRMTFTEWYEAWLDGKRDWWG